MPEQNATDAAHTHARAVVAADAATTILGMTAEGFAKAVELGNTTWNYQSYELGEEEVVDGDALFDIAYATDDGGFTLRYRFRVVDDAWKVVDLDRVG